LAEHRHRVDKAGKSMRIVLVTQDLSQVAAFACALIEQTYRVVKKTKKSYRVDIYSGAAKGDRPPKSLLQRQSFGTFKAEVHRYYSSATMSQTGDVGDESKADQRGNIWASPILWLMVLVIPLLIGGGVYGVRQFFAPVLGNAEPQVPPLVNPPPPLPDPVRVSSAQRAVEAVSGVSVSGQVPYSSVWRVAGWGGCSIPLNDGSGGMRPCGEASSGGVTISRTSTAVLVSEGGSQRVVPMADCRWIEQDRYVLCDIDGERVTPWTGRGAVTQVVDPAAKPANRVQSAPTSERSDLGGADAHGLPAAQVSSPGVASGVTVVADSEYPSRPWR
jgi:zona occludens toxin